jgi:hypothetical protein
MTHSAIYIISTRDLYSFFDRFISMTLPPVFYVLRFLFNPIYRGNPIPIRCQFDNNPRAPHGYDPGMVFSAGYNSRPVFSFDPADNQDPGFVYCKCLDFKQHIIEPQLLSLDEQMSIKMFNILWCSLTMNNLKL